MSVEIAWKQNILVTDFHLLKSLLVVLGFGSQAFDCGFSRQNINSVWENTVFVFIIVCRFTCSREQEWGRKCCHSHQWKWRGLLGHEFRELRFSGVKGRTFDVLVRHFQLRCSTSVLVFGCWLINHVIYLELRQKWLLLQAEKISFFTQVWKKS